MLSVKKYLMMVLCMLALPCMYGQVISEDEAVEKALMNYPSIRIAEIRVKQQKAREKTAFNPDQLKFTVEAPTDYGLEFEVEQEFDFPTVYSNRSKWLRGQTDLMAEQAQLTRYELKREVRLAYLDAQLANAQLRYFNLQDSIWKQIADKSKRLYEGGDLNKGELLFAERQSGLSSFRAMIAQTDAVNALDILNSYTGEATDVQPIQALSYETDSNGAFYFEKYIAENIRVADQEAEVWRAERWPGLIIGMVKYAEFDNESQYRFKGGITVPLWQGQYTGEIQAAKAEVERLQAEKDLKIRQANLERITWEGRLEQAQNSIKWFESNILPQTTQLIETYERLYAGGQSDYAQTLESIAEASGAYPEFLEVLRVHNEAVIELEYLNGE